MYWVEVFNFFIKIEQSFYFFSFVTLLLTLLFFPLNLTKFEKKQVFLRIWMNHINRIFDHPSNLTNKQNEKNSYPIELDNPTRD